MFIRIHLFAGALALIVASSAMAYDYGTKGTAMQNIENRPRSSPQVVVSNGPIEKHYDKAGVASINRDADARRLEASRVVIAETRYATDACTRNSSGSSTSRSSAYKPAYYATHER